MKKRRPVIEERTDRHRGCGWRTPGGLYLIADRPAAACPEASIPLDVCPTCGNGFPPHRGWKWINGNALVDKCGWSRQDAPIERGFEAGRRTRCPQCAACPLAGPLGRCGLLWIGVRHYPRPTDWLAEAAAMGISLPACRQQGRGRLPTIPRDLELGRTWAMVAHRKAILNADGSYTAAVFQVFRPRAVEYVVADDDPPKKLAALARRGATLIRVRRIVDTPMFGTMPAGQPARPKSPPPRRGQLATGKPTT